MQSKKVEKRKSVKFSISAILLMLAVIISTLYYPAFAHAGTIPYMTLSFSYVPPEGFHPHDLIELNTYLNGGGNNVTYASWSWGDETKQVNTTLHEKEIMITVYHQYANQGQYLIYVNATSDLCYNALDFCQYFMGSIAITIGRSLSQTNLMISPMTVDVAQTQPFTFTATASTPEGNRIPYANFTFFVLPLTTGPTDRYTWIPIGQTQAGQNGTATYQWYPMVADWYAVECNFTGSAKYEPSSMVIGLNLNAGPNIIPRAVPEFVSPILLLIFLPVLVAFSLKRRRNKLAGVN